MWKIVLFVLGLSYVVLFVLLRSVVLPLKAVLMNLLSRRRRVRRARRGLPVGLGDGFSARVDRVIHAITPPLVLAVVFGLSMDYEVFLLSRIRERYDGDRRHPPRRRRGPRDQRPDDHQRRADHGRGVRVFVSTACRR